MRVSNQRNIAKSSNQASCLANCETERGAHPVERRLRRRTEWRECAAARGSVDRKGGRAGDRQRSVREMISNIAAAPRDVVASSGRLIAQRNLARQPELLRRPHARRAYAMTDSSTLLDGGKTRARAWFEALRD